MMRFEKGTPEYIEFRRKANERNRRYYSKPEVMERKRIYSKKYRQENKEKISEYGYELRSKPETIERIKRWREDNKEHLKLKGKEWREKNKIMKNKMDREYRRKRRKDPKYIKRDKQRQKKFRDENPERIKKYNQKYYTSPKGIISYNNHNHRRLALIKGRETDLTGKKVKEIFDRDKACVYCGSNIKRELGHIVPLAKGGSCMFNNFVVACKKCNCSKSDRDIFYWCKLREIKVPEIVLRLLGEQKN